MEELIVPYLKAHESAWSPTTLKSERARLNGISGLYGLSPLDLYTTLQSKGMKPYSIKTLFIRLAAMEKWGKCEPKFQEFLKTHANRFKHAYQKQEIAISYEEAQARIQTLAEPYRTMATSLLASGLRISESYKVKEGKVAGKGGKVRKVFGILKLEGLPPKSTFTRKLKAAGLRPHDLRRLSATRLAEKGASAADLCKVYGWSDIRTSYQYLQAKDDERIKQLMETEETRS